MNSTAKIIIVGAGYGGVLTAKKLLKKMRGLQGLEITLIDRNTYHTMLTELHEVVAGRVPEQSVRIDLQTIFAGRPIKVVQDEILNVDLTSRQVISEKASYTYDYLVIGTGSKPVFYGIKGADANCFQLWSYENAVRLRDHIISQFRKASNESNPDVRRARLCFITVGCGFTGVEMAGELAEWVPRLCCEFRIDPAEVNLMAVDVLPQVLGIFPDPLVRKVERRLEKLGVKIYTGKGIQEVGNDYAVLDGLGKISTETVIWTAGIQGSHLAESLALKKESRHRVVTNPYLQAVEHREVFVVGDNVYILAGKDQRPVPQMVENAELTAELVAHNLRALIVNKPLKPYSPHFHGAMVSVGGRYGVAHIGLPGRFVSLSGFPAMFVKHFINLVYFFQVAGLNKCWSYLKNEFFRVPDHRSFLGGHFAKTSPNFWLVPLRVFVGAKWFLEGLEKLPRILGDPSKIFLIPPPTNGVRGYSWAEDGEGFEDAGEAISGATAAVPASPGPDATSAATYASLGSPSLPSIDSGGFDGTAGTGTIYGEALPVPDFVTEMTNRVMDLFFYTSDGSYTVLAQLFQTAMVLGEMTIGLCLIAGLFTFPASAAALLMCLMIWASGMAGPEILWYFAAAFATMGGSGRVFGLDYYVLPWIKSHWNRIPLVRKWYMFID